MHAQPGGDPRSSRTTALVMDPYPCWLSGAPFAVLKAGTWGCRFSFPPVIFHNWAVWVWAEQWGDREGQQQGRSQEHL